MACARARWKIETEGFNLLRSNGYHLEHKFSHGKHNLAMMFAALNLLAFAIHTVCDCLEQIWIDAKSGPPSSCVWSSLCKLASALVERPDAFGGWDAADLPVIVPRVFALGR